MTEWAAKRFWKDTCVVKEGAGFAVHLDGRMVRTPAKAPLVVPTRALADMIAAEWEAQQDQIDPNTMPSTRGANAAIDKVAVQHAEVADMLAEYGDSDLLCYRADHPKELVARQEAGWDPLLDWAASELGADLEPRTGVMHAPQNADALAELRDRVHAFSPFELAAFHDLVSISGSLVLGFAVTKRRLSAQEAWDLSCLDEAFQIEQWGQDDEAAKTAAYKRESFLHAAKFFDAVS